jgi:hypothetical protein
MEIPEIFNKKHMKKIKLTKVEIKSKLSRQNRAEGLILQLPNDHGGRNSWLLNYGIKEEAQKLRKEKGLKFKKKYQACEIIKSTKDDHTSIN